MPSRSVALRMSAVVAFALLAAACSPRLRALDIVGCDEIVEPYLTQWSGQLWGAGTAMMVKLETRDARGTALVYMSCVPGKADFRRTRYPARSIGMQHRWWWDLQSGEPIEFVPITRADQRWMGLVYRKQAGTGFDWYIFAKPSCGAEHSGV